MTQTNRKLAQKIAILGIEYDIGGAKHGSSEAPNALRNIGLIKSICHKGYSVEDFGNLKLLSNHPRKMSNKELFLDITLKSYNKIDYVLKNNYFPIVLGGDHSIAIGTAKALLNNYPDLGIIWIDAHADINTEESSLTGRYHGMPLASILGLTSYFDFKENNNLLKKNNLVYIGLRDLDPFEEKVLNELSIKSFYMKDIQMHGIQNIMQQAILYLKNTSHLHISFDVDSIDPLVAPATNTPVKNGLSLPEVEKIFYNLNKQNNISSLEIVDYNPLLDDDNATAKIIINLINILFDDVN